MDLKTLRYFTVVAQELNITHAAETLHMSQPPLSAQMHALERELGSELFVRGKRKLQLTEAGRVLYRRAEQLLELAERTRQDVEALRGEMKGSIALGLVEGRAPYLAARWMRGFCEEYGDVHFSLWNGSSDDVTERLLRGLCDVAIIASPFDNERLEAVSVGREAWVAIIPSDHPLAAQPVKRVSLRELAGERLIVPSRKSRREALYRWFAEIGAEPDIVCDTSNYIDSVALSEQGVGIAIFPQTTYTPNPLVVSKIISESERQIEYFLVRDRQSRLSPVAEEFVNFVCDMAEEERIHPPILRSKAETYVPAEGTAFL